MAIYTLIGKIFRKCFIFSTLGVGGLPVDGFSIQILLLMHFGNEGFLSELQN